MLIRYVCHPEVAVDPAVPIPRWHLDPVGITRMRRFAAALPRPGAIWASTECKAIEAAGLLAAHHGCAVQVHPGLDENDRSSTGYLPPSEFQAAADAFFAEPDTSFRGWERARDAQTRVLAAFRAITAAAPGEDLVLVGHGGTGTLLLCALAGWAIDRRHDAPRQGCHWLLDPAQGSAQGLVHPWRPLEEA